MEVFTIGFTKTSAAEFFGKLDAAGIGRLIDVRLNNRSQLAGFAKRNDLEFFLRQLCGIEYLHEPLLAPTPELLKAYRREHDDWSTYAHRFRQLMAARRIEDALERDLFHVPSVLLCSEATAACCHRRLVLEYLQETWGNLDIVHL